MMRKCCVSITILCLYLIFAAPLLAAKIKLTFDHYYDGPAVVKALHDLQRDYPELATLRSIGKSEEDRDIWLFTINNGRTGQDTEKPGIYIDGSIHGNEIQATEVCLYLAWYLLDSYDTNPKIKELVDSRAFYIIPMVNVDSRWRFFTDPTHFDIGRSAHVPYDDDRDGLVDEDGCDDLDGDGEILQMRIKYPFGDRKSHPDDPRAMIRVKPGEKGEWKILGMEGIDNDEDGRLNEDWPGYLDMNRNYGFKWQPPYVQGGAGDFPMSAKITKAIADLVVSKPNITFNFAFHNWGGIFLRGPGSKLAGMYPPADVEVYDFLGHEAQKIIPGYRYGMGYKDMYTTHGDFDEWMFSCLGIYGFVAELFMGSQEQFKKPGVEADRKKQKAYEGGISTEEKLKFNDFVSQGIMFREWRKFNHPQFGEIEIGGWRAFTTRAPQLFMLPELVHRNTSVVLFIAQHTPDITLALIDVTKLSRNLHRIRVRASNANAIPTLSHKAFQNDLSRKDILKCEGSGLTVVSGGIIEDIHLDKVVPVAYRPWLIFTSIPSFGKREVQWLVTGHGEGTITFDSKKAQNRSLEFKL
ncbi:M14 family metallopeptidase [candidate division CSSED10-310 bacterium]|uniref:M14 family metallopeptidase n=1 Tax=candidate division CSSED10-310 bacterium TaxID=2855610 RepID=A0ABV6YY91_UNCC1